MHAPYVVCFDSSEQVFSQLISSAYRKNSLSRMQLARCKPQMIAALRRCMKRGSPVQLTLLAFPFKVPNPAKVGQRCLPDAAELAAIQQLAMLRNSIQAVYPPGLEFHILHDGPLIADVFGVDIGEVRQYEAYFSGLVAKAAASDFIRCHDFGELQRQHAPDPRESLERLRSQAQRWWQQHRGTAEWQRKYQRTFGMMNLRSLPAAAVAALMEHSRAGSLPGAYEGLERRVHRAMVQYDVQDAIIHQFDPRLDCFPDAIHATTQDRPERLSLWLVRRGRSLLPWHGIGCIDARGRTQVRQAIDVSESQNQAEFIPGEETPFAYRAISNLLSA